MPRKVEDLAPNMGSRRRRRRPEHNPRTRVNTKQAGQPKPCQQKPCSHTNKRPSRLEHNPRTHVNTLTHTITIPSRKRQTTFLEERKLQKDTCAAGILPHFEKASSKGSAFWQVRASPSRRRVSAPFRKGVEQGASSLTGLSKPVAEEGQRLGSLFESTPGSREPALRGGG